MAYTIGEIAKIIDESPHTLRYYAKIGLLPFGSRNENGIRIYEEKDLEFFYVIKCLKKAKMSLEQIRKFILYYLKGDSTIPQRHELFLQQRDIVKKELEELQEVYNNLQFRCWFFSEAEKAGTVHIKEILSKIDVPEEMKPLVEKYGDSLQLGHKK